MSNSCTLEKIRLDTDTLHYDSFYSVHEDSEQSQQWSGTNVENVKLQTIMEFKDNTTQTIRKREEYYRELVQWNKYILKDQAIQTECGMILLVNVGCQIEDLSLTQDCLSVITDNRYDQNDTVVSEVGLTMKFNVNVGV